MLETEMNNVFGVITNRLDIAEERISERESKVNRNFPNLNAKRKKRKTKEQCIKEVKDNFRRYNTYISEITEVKEM